MIRIGDFKLKYSQKWSKTANQFKNFSYVQGKKLSTRNITHIIQNSITHTYLKLPNPGLFAIAAITALSLGIYYAVRPNKNEEDDQYIDPMMRFDSNPNLWYENFTTSAVISDSDICNEFAEKILHKGGSSIDAIIVVNVCIGLVQPAASGLAGGLFLTYTNDITNRHFTVNGRETAPENSNMFMFENLPEDGSEGSSTLGGISSGIPGVVRALYTAHSQAGNLPWKDLFQDTIDLARNGYKVDEKMNEYRSYLTRYINNDENSPYNFSFGDWSIFFREDGTMKQIGDTIIDNKLADTMEKIAEDPENFYTGELMEMIIEDLKEAGSIITQNDMKNYQADIDYNPVVSSLDDWSPPLDMILPPVSSSGALFAYMIGTLHLYDKTDMKKDAQSYHRLVEAFKYGYGQRSHLGDPYDDEFGEEILERLANLTDPENWAITKSLIRDDVTFQDSSHYGQETLKENHGTSHFACLTNNDAVSVTSSVNTIWASKVKGKRTGLVFNNHMDDFSRPTTENYWQAEPSKENFIKPGKRPQSSMVPILIKNKNNGKTVLAVGGSGGTRITSSVIGNVFETLIFGDPINLAVSQPRLHHQLEPMVLKYQAGFDGEILKGLEERGHVLEEYSYSSGTAPMIYRDPSGVIHAKGDNRKPNCTPGGVGRL